MTNFKHQGLAKALLCLSMLLNAGSINADPLDFEGPNLIGPRRPSCQKQDWENKKPEGQRENSRTKRNAIAVKYGLIQYTIDPRVSHRDITLLQAAENFKNEVEKLKVKTKKDLDEIDTFGQLVISSGNVVTQSLLEGNVQEETTKCMFAQSIYRCVAFLGSFFNN
jgi:hypothetical protein